MSEHLIYRGGDWKAIANDLYPDSDFTRYLKKKAQRSCDQFGPVRPFGETVTERQAQEIYRSAGQRGLHPLDKQEE